MIGITDVLVSSQIRVNWQVEAGSDGCSRCRFVSFFHGEGAITQRRLRKTRLLSSDSAFRLSKRLGSLTLSGVVQVKKWPRTAKELVV